jgi:hypothetical protein
MRAARSHWADARRIVDVRHKTEGVGVVAEEVTLNSAHTSPLSASRPITRGSQAASRHPSNHVYRGGPTEGTNEMPCVLLHLMPNRWH